MGIETAIIGSALIGGAASSRGAKKAAQAQTQAADESARVQREIFERQTELQEPFRQAGISSQNELMRLLGIGGDATAADYGMLTRGFTPEQMQMDPGYAFRLAEGEKALERMQAARGQLLGGGAIRAGTRYGQEMGSQEYMNAFNRAQAQLGTRLGTLGSLYGAGQAAAQQVAGQAGQMGANVGNLLMQGGQARASGYLGQANALSQALGQGAMGYGLARGGYFSQPTGVSPGAIDRYRGTVS
jgi:PPE-repeat protein